MISSSTQPSATTAILRGAFLRAVEQAREAAAALRSWLRGATGAQKYESYLRHTSKCGQKPLSEHEFYLDDVKRKYSRPNRCC
jgi:uncharacterized short protein YbdD (DUF466 family)